MKILFLDQSGKPGGAELCLLDIAKPFSDSCLVGLFADGDFRKLLENYQVPVKVLTTKSITIRKKSSFLSSLISIQHIIPLVNAVISHAKNYDLIYANTQKALVVGAIASFLTRVPLVYHLHDILSLEHFSHINLQIAINFANRFASLVITNSQASKDAFIQAGGISQLVEVVYNGFDMKNYQVSEYQIQQIRNNLAVENKFVIGHFSRLSPWKGQHILIEALAHVPDNITAILVGDALFGEYEYVRELHQKVHHLQLEHRVKFLGFRQDIPQLMSACDLVTHTSIAPEPFGRVIVEAMLCGKIVIAAKSGGAVELIENGTNGFLVTPNQPQELADIIKYCFDQQQQIQNIAIYARQLGQQKFDLNVINQKIQQLILTRLT